MSNLDPNKRESSLDVSPEAFAQISAAAVELVREYFTHIADRPVRAKNQAGKTLGQVETTLNAEGVPIQRLIRECRTVIDLSRHNGHPRFFGYVASPATPIGAFSDLIASALNANITCWRSGPAGTEIERMVVQWLGSLIGYDANAKGLLTSGGSMANLIALLIASRRTTGSNTAGTGLWNSGPPVTIYASSEVHMSIPKAADVLGLGRDYVRTVDCDAELRLNPSSLRKLIEQDLRDGLRPSCVVGSAGTVATGIVDPLVEIADIAQEFKLWFHVDGAYGAPGVLDTSRKELFAGLERADSISLDPHKWLYVPVDAGCLLLRDEVAARAAFNTDDADYIKVHGHLDDEAFAFWDYGVELSRRFRALKVWLTLRYYGTRRIAAAISDDIALAQYLTEIISAAPDLELLAPAELSICCFRYVPARMKAQLAEATDVAAVNEELDRLNERIMSRVQTGGQAYLSNANVKGRFALRVCITNFRTTMADVERTVEIVREAGRQLSSE